MKYYFILIIIAICSCQPLPACDKTATECIKQCDPLPVALFRPIKCNQDKTIIVNNEDCVCGVAKVVPTEKP